MKDFGKAFAKAQLAAGNTLPLKGNVFVSVRDADKEAIVRVARELKDMGFNIIATRGTAKYLNEKGIEAELVLEGHRRKAEYSGQDKEQGDSRCDKFVLRVEERRRLLFNKKKLDRDGSAVFTTVSGAYAATKAIKAILERGAFGQDGAGVAGDWQRHEARTESLSLRGVPMR